MNNSVLLTTIHSQNNNFGSVWQAYALSIFVEQLGYNIKTLDYRPYYSNGLTSPKKAVTMLGGKLLHPAAVCRREKKFQEFISSRPLTQCYRTYKAIQDSPPLADVYLLGSDQVWNPDYLCGRDQTYYLDYVSNSRKIAFSASVGRMLRDNEISTLIDRISEFSFISLREDLSAQQLAEAGRHDAVHTLDPVFLLDRKQYLDIAGKEPASPSNDYILTYIIHKDPVMASIVDCVQKATGKTVIQMGGLASKCTSDYYLRDAGPLDFVRLIDGCSIFITSSFHGIAFAHILKKNFIAKLPSDGRLRIESILRDAGTSSRLIRTPEEAISLAETHIDYRLVERNIHPLIDYSKSFLTSMLEG